MATPLRRGGIALEVALTLPIFVLLLIGVMEWGWALPRQATLEHIARDAARAGALTESSLDPLAAATTRATERLAEAAFDTGSASIGSTSYATSSGDVIAVTISVPYTALFGLVPTPLTLEGSATMRLEDQ